MPSSGDEEQKLLSTLHAVFGCGLIDEEDEVVWIANLLVILHINQSISALYLNSLHLIQNLLCNEFAHLASSFHFQLAGIPQIT